MLRNLILNFQLISNFTPITQVYPCCETILVYHYIVEGIQLGLNVIGFATLTNTKVTVVDNNVINISFIPRASYNNSAPFQQTFCQ